MIFIGTDIEEVSRFEKLKKSKPELLNKLFSIQELEYVKSKMNAQSLTGIWCAKEATVKALSQIKILDIRSVHIDHHPNGTPFVSQIVNFDHKKYCQITLSISHTKNYAIATCLVSYIS